MKIQFNTVTWYSKLGAIILFVLVVPVLTFYIGMKYEETVSVLQYAPTIVSVRKHINPADYAPAKVDDAKETDRFFGEPVIADLNGDKQADLISFMTKDFGGSGTFFYVVAHINRDGKYIPTNMIDIGDRISPQNIHVVNGLIEVNYADRKPGEAMATWPSVGVTKRLKLEGDMLVEVK